MSLPPERPTEDEALDKVLGELGPRRGVPSDVMEEVRESVHAEWRNVVLTRQRRHRLFAYGLAASGVVALLMTIGALVLFGNRTPIATVARVVGTLEVSDDGTGDWRRVNAGEQIRRGEVVRAGADGRIALALSSGIQVRVDAESLVDFEAAERVSLVRGAVYVDADPATTHDKTFAVQTPYGSVSHVGTQFEVRSHGRFVEVNVREGSVRFHSDRGDQVAAAGERLRLTDSNIERTQISLQDPAWQWALQVAPEFAIEGVPVVDFLHWVARETGRKVIFATPDAEQAAREVILHGSIGGLSPAVALPAVLSTTQLTLTHSDSRTIGIALKAL